MKEIFDYCTAFRYGEKIDDPEFVHRAESFSVQRIANEYPIALDAAKDFRKHTDGFYEFVYEDEAKNCLIIGAWLAGEPVEAVISLEDGTYCSYNAEDGTY